jgi:hypothetical protein
MQAIVSPAGSMLTRPRSGRNADRRHLRELRPRRSGSG